MWKTWLLLIVCNWKVEVDEQENYMSEEGENGGIRDDGIGFIQHYD